MTRWVAVMPLLGFAVGAVCQWRINLVGMWLSMAFSVVLFCIVVWGQRRSRRGARR